jgi:hypothetical protein
MIAGFGERKAEIIEQMHGAWPCSPNTNAELAGEFGIAGGHKGSRLFVAYANILDLTLPLAHGLNQAGDAVTHETENVRCSPGD